MRGPEMGGEGPWEGCGDGCERNDQEASLTRGGRIVAQPSGETTVKEECTWHRSHAS